jgi:hypothetical protein
VLVAFEEALKPVRECLPGCGIATPNVARDDKAVLVDDVDPRFFPHGDDFRGLRVHQTRLQGGDASSDSYCFVN